MEAVIENGIIVNRIVGHIDGSFPIIDNHIAYNKATQIMTKEEVIDTVNKVVNIVYTIREKTQLELDADFKLTVPKTITPRQARLVLLGAGLLDDIETLLATDKAMQIWWEYSLDIERDNAHIVTAGTTLGLTELQLDEMFIAASKL